MHHISSKLNLLQPAHQILMRQLFDGLSWGDWSTIWRLHSISFGWHFPILDFKIISNIVQIILSEVQNINLLFFTHRYLIFYWKIACITCSTVKSTLGPSVFISRGKTTSLIYGLFAYYANSEGEVKRRWWLLTMVGIRVR